MGSAHFWLDPDAGEIVLAIIILAVAIMICKPDQFRWKKGRK